MGRSGPSGKNTLVKVPKPEEDIPAYCISRTWTMTQMLNSKEEKEKNERKSGKNEKKREKTYQDEQEK
nr:hypothetical protein BaRGS_010414 [Batillaria attramentaria]